jgi:hypothetical protein
MLLSSPFLAKYDGTPGNTVADALWSFHTYYRRGTCTHLSRKQPTSKCKATDMEVNEEQHAHWCRQHSSAIGMTVAYL